MNSRERYIRALRFAGPDRVPTIHRTIPGAFQKYGRELEDLYARYPSDALLSTAGRTGFAFQRGVGESSGRFKGAKDEWGCVWDSLSDEYLGQVIGHPLDDWSKLEGYKFPEPTVGRDGIAEMLADVEADNHQHYVMFLAGTLWQQTFWLRGFENALIDVLEDRPEMYFLRDRITDFLVARVDLLAKHRGHVDGIVVNDDWGTQQALMIRPAHWRKVYKPAYARIVEAIHDAGFFAHLHTDGVTSEIFDDLIEIGFDELNPQMSCMDVAALGERWGGEVCFRADMDRQYTLPYGTPEEAEAYVQRMFDAFGRFCGGYIGYGEMNSDIPLANLEAMLAAFTRLRYG
ncbi:MAG: uroporphyrinogen decarboxylase family protein [Chloroflexota bacterium]